MILMSSVLVTACSDNSGKQAAAPAASQQQPAAAKTPEKADPFGKFAQPVTVTQVLGFRPPEDPKTPKGITPEQNGYLKQLKDMLNIDVKYMWTVPTEQYEQKFSLAVASGDLPDLMVVDQKMFEKLYEQGMLADITDAYKTYASPTLKKYVEGDGGFALGMFTRDGKIYGLPSYEDPYMSTQIMWIRTDWLKNLGLEPPKTIDELEKVAEAFVKNDPDKNGKADTYGLALQKKLIFWGFDARGLFNSMGAYPTAWLKGSDGKLMAGEIQPETKNVLAKLQSWYQKGILDKEWALKDDQKAVEDIVAGKVGISFGEWWYPNWPLNLNKDKDPNAEWKPFPLPSFDGKPGKSLVNKIRLNKVVVVNKKAKHPEAVIKMASFYNEMERSKYKDINKAENGWVYNWYEPRIYNPNNFENLFQAVNEAVANKKDKVESEKDETVIQGADEVFKAAKDYLAGDKKAWGLYFSRAADDGGWGLTRKIRDQKLVTFNEYYGPATPTQVEKGASLDKLMDETFTKIIMGSAPIDEFDKYVSSWKKLGGDDITKEINDWYAKNAK
ncbi:ABC transporter substrate-binding protein [Gordoniibacillus kamchatkensis]|uniref:ABC transporter substrate-binding protein n=2 Tax=Gordoniibacillus kamchatkensis TaxID=1590651 RepID=A0ABR5AJ34_9BACL|nr:ABC transporter substrate-binding protein [Paenibacillus sp. VKM B-2647]